MVFLMCALSIIPYPTLLPFLSLGSVFGVLRYLEESFFLWTTAQDIIHTIDNLVKRNLPLVQWCCLCYCDGEIVDHLLMEWNLSDVWNAVGDAKDSCFSSFCMGELFGDTLFFGLVYGVSLFNVANLEGIKYRHFWGFWETCWSLC